MLTLKGWIYAGITAVMLITWSPFLLIDLLLISLSMLFEWITERAMPLNEFLGGKVGKYFNKMKANDLRTYAGWARAYQWRERKALGKQKVRERPADVPKRQKLTENEFLVRVARTWPGRK